MEVVIVADAEAAGAIAAGIVERLLADKPDAVIGVATGSSPIITYRRLVEAFDAGRISFADAHACCSTSTSVSPPIIRSATDASCTSISSIMSTCRPTTSTPPMSTPTTWPPPVARYEALLAELGGVDVQLLGIGTDGHVGFNEPGSSLRSRTRIKTLTAATRADNARFFEHPDDVPRHVMTQGLATIGDARHLVLIACGAAKAAPVAAAVEGPLTTSCPASILQWHPHVTVVIDEDAASGLAHSAYYRETHAGKPSWQHY